VRVLLEAASAYDQPPTRKWKNAEMTTVTFTSDMDTDTAHGYNADIIIDVTSIVSCWWLSFGRFEYTNNVEAQPQNAGHRVSSVQAEIC
jgi:hypothetical protein